MEELRLNYPVKPLGTRTRRELTVAVLGADLYVIRPLDHAPLTGQAQAAFDAVLLAGGLQDLGVDEFDQAAVVHIDEEDPAQDAHLGGGQTGAVGVRQGFGHVVEQVVEALVKVCHRAGDLMQGRLLLGHDGAKCHRNNAP